MAASEGSELQLSLKIGDTVLLYAKDVMGYVFSEDSRYIYSVVANCINGIPVQSLRSSRS